MRSRILVCLIVVGVFGMAASSQQHGGTVVIADESAILTLDPHTDVFSSSSYVIMQMFESLVQLDESGSVQPELATSWTTSEDELTITFYLRQGVRFQHGHEMTADDVVASLERTRDPASPNAAELSVVQAIRAVDRYTVELSLSEPFSPLLPLLSQYWHSIAPADVLEEYGGLDTHPIGTGPFVLKERRADGYVILERNPDYWNNPLPYLDQVVFRPMQETDERMAAFLNGDVDLVLGVPMSGVRHFEALDGISLFRPIGQVFSWLGMNHRIAPFDDVRVRQAVAFAINRRAILDVVHEGRGYVLNCGPVAGDLWYGCDTEIYPADGDVSQAKALLTQAGYPEGFETTILLPIGYERMNAEFALTRGFLAEIGIRATLLYETLEQIGARYATSDIEMYADAWPTFSDPHTIFYGAFHSLGGYNIGGFSDPDVDAWILQASQEPTQEGRAALYQQISERITVEAASVFHVQTAWYGAYRSSKIEGFVDLPIEGLDMMAHLWIAEGDGDE